MFTPIIQRNTHTTSNSTSDKAQATTAARIAFSIELAAEHAAAMISTGVGILGLTAYPKFSSPLRNPRSLWNRLFHREESVFAPLTMRKRNEMTTQFQWFLHRNLGEPSTSGVQCVFFVGCGQGHHNSPQLIIMASQVPAASHVWDPGTLSDLSEVGSKTL